MRVMALALLFTLPACSGRPIGNEPDATDGSEQHDAYPDAYPDAHSDADADADTGSQSEWVGAHSCVARVRNGRCLDGSGQSASWNTKYELEKWRQRLSRV